MLNETQPHTTVKKICLSIAALSMITLLMNPEVNKSTRALAIFLISSACLLLTKLPRIDHCPRKNPAPPGK